jgi:hypothetical protein
MAEQGVAWAAWLGAALCRLARPARHGGGHGRRCVVWLGNARLGVAWPVEAGLARPGTAGQGRQGVARQGRQSPAMQRLPGPAFGRRSYCA